MISKKSTSQLTKLEAIEKSKAARVADAAKAMGGEDEGDAEGDASAKAPYGSGPRVKSNNTEKRPSCCSNYCICGTRLC